MLFETRNSKAECKALPMEVLFECIVILQKFWNFDEIFHK